MVQPHHMNIHAHNLKQMQNHTSFWANISFCIWMCVYAWMFTSITTSMSALITNDADVTDNVKLLFGLLKKWQLPRYANSRLENEIVAVNAIYVLIFTSADNSILCILCIHCIYTASCGWSNVKAINLHWYSRHLSNKNVGK